MGFFIALRTLANPHGCGEDPVSSDLLLKKSVLRLGRALAVSPALLAILVTPAAVASQTLPSPPPIRTQAAGQGVLTPRQLEIMRIVRAGDGYVTEDLHREFWEAVDFDPQSAEAKRILTPIIEAVIGLAETLGYETWVSARLSLHAGKPVRSKGLDDAIEASLSASDVPGFRENAKKSVSSVTPILEAAAYGTPLQTARGPILINDDLIETTLAGIEGGTRRFRMLMNPKWEMKHEQYRYPVAHVSVLAPWPFLREDSELTVPNGRKSQMQSLSRTISDKQIVYIAFADFSGDPNRNRLYWPDPQGTAIRNVQASLDAVGAEGRPPYGKAWRGNIAATGSGTVEAAAGRIHVSVRNVYLPEHKGFLTFMAVSEISLFDSQLLLDELEANSQVLR